jgi:RNA polymerase sigma-70 factor (ECF subfamily)
MSDVGEDSDQHPSEVVRSDAVLMERIGSRDTAALGELYARYAPIALALSLRILSDRREAEDTVHDAFVAVWERSDQFAPGRGSVVAWLITTVRNLALDHARRRGRRARIDADALRYEPREQVASPEDLSIGAWNAQDIRRALAGLPKDRRNVLETAFFEGLTYAQIAEREGVPIGTIKSRAARALVSLRETLETTANSADPPLTGPTGLR